MKNIACEGDATTHGGNILSGTDRIQVNGRRAAHVGAKVSCPMHGDNEVIEGSSRMRCGSTLISCDGDQTRCGAHLIASADGARVI
ncbi:PAAR domain-containing protein [Pandoraea cepalis]|uniref:PAAR domain-containing protein n=1 Tax=Pandoraea cepalis TaxID=2508294 RepID=UPI00123F2F50|nr:PAAR domain-containing protein [Pandoraea cepalis]